jgi:hypothetical protein
MIPPGRHETLGELGEEAKKNQIKKHFTIMKR